MKSVPLPLYMYSHLFLDLKANMVTLMRLSTHNGVIKIMQQTAARYKDIGILLLNDRNGAIVRRIEESARGDPV